MNCSPNTGKGIATTYCPSGEYKHGYVSGKTREALDTTATYRDIFGKDNYFVEIMDHTLTLREGHGKSFSILPANSGCRSSPQTTFTMSHGTMRKFYDTICVSNPFATVRPEQVPIDAEEFYLKTADEMYRTIPGTDVFPSVRQHSPHRGTLQRHLQRRCGPDALFPVPEGETINTWFDKEVRAGGTPIPRRCATLTEKNLLIMKPK